MRLVWCLPVIAFARPATANMPQLPAHYAPLFEHAHSWTYDVATTIYDIEDFHKARPPKKTIHTTVVCKVAQVVGFHHGAAAHVACDGDPDAGYPIAGDWGATEDGLYRLTRFPKTEAELTESLGEQIVGAKHVRDLVGWIAIIHASNPRRVADRDMSPPVRQPLERFLPFRALLRCFLPGGPPALPFGVLESPGFFTLAIGRG